MINGSVFRSTGAVLRGNSKLPCKNPGNEIAWIKNLAGFAEIIGEAIFNKYRSGKAARPKKLSAKVLYNSKFHFEHSA